MIGNGESQSVTLFETPKVNEKKKSNSTGQSRHTLRAAFSLPGKAREERGSEHTLSM